MPPKIIYARDDIIRAAFETVREESLKGLTARNVAKKLGSSTAPVYSQFSTMEELEREILIKAKDLLFQYCLKPYTDRIFLNMGTGLAVFARDQRNLYRALFLERADYSDIVDEFLGSLNNEMKRDIRFTGMSDNDRETLLTKMWIFTHGLASLICVGLAEKICGGLADEVSDEGIIDLLKAVGTVVIRDALENNN